MSEFVLGIDFGLNSMFSTFEQIFRSFLNNPVSISIMGSTSMLSLPQKTCCCFVVVIFILMP